MNICPHCGKPYEEKVDASYGHRPKGVGWLRWCHPKSIQRRIEVQKAAKRKKK